jgi:hypothetical protein
MAIGDAYTLGVWRVKEGKEQDFVGAWKGDLLEVFFALPKPPEHGTLIRSTEDPQLFYSFGPWPSLEAIQEMFSDPRAQETFQKLFDMCEEAKPGPFQVVATAP